MNDPSAITRRVNASLFRICQRSTFFAALALHARIDITTDLPTAATDGQRIFVNPGFFDPLTSAEQDGLLLHEVLHAALQHVPRRKNRDAKLWNIAADIVVNGIILAEGHYALPEGGVIDESLQHLSVEEVYEKLASQVQEKPLTVMVDLLETPPGEAQPAKGQLDPAAAQKPDWQQVIEEAKLITQSSAIGKVPERMKRELGRLERSNVDWRAHLWRYMVQTPTDFGDFDRRFIGAGLYLETLSAENVRVAVAIDTSGSINSEELTALTSEVRAILQSYPHLKCDLYYADAAVHGPFQLTPSSPLPDPIGGGGTDFRPFFERLMENRSPWTPTVAVYLTDGYGDFPEVAPDIPTLWAVTPGGRDLDSFPFGEVVRILPHE